MPSILSSMFSRDWSIQDLMQAESGRQQRAGGCGVELVRTYHELQQETILERFKKFFTRRKDLMNVYYITFKFKVTSDTGHSYTVFIRTLADPDGSEQMNNRIQVWCGCPDFKFRSAYNLNKHNALFRTPKTDAVLGPGLTEAPKAKSTTSTLCKHSMAAVNFFVQNYSYLMSGI